jgi:hypothetical protein
MGNGVTLLWKSNPDIVPGPSWTSVNLDFIPSILWHVGTSNGPLATFSDFATAQSNLTGLFIRGEYSTGLVESPGLDNVTLAGVTTTTTPVPAPSALAVTAIAGVTVATARRSRQKSRHRPPGRAE